jgi:YVTN family beta-propeller protein
MSKSWLHRLATVTAAATFVATALAGCAVVVALGVGGAVAPAGASGCSPHCPNPLPDPMVYVADNGSGTVSVFDAITYAVTGSVDVGSGPTGVAVDQPAGTVYVTNTDSDSVSVVSEATLAVTTTIALGYGTAPTGVVVTPDGATAYVADSGTDVVSVIDTSTNAVTATIAVGDDPTAVAVGPNGADVYVTDTLSNAVSVIATATNSVTSTVGVGEFPSAITVGPLGNYVYVTNECGKDEYCDSRGTLSRIGTSKNTVTTYTVGYAPVAVAVTPDAESLYVVNSCGPQVTPPPKPLPGPDCGDDQGADPANVTTFDVSTMTVESDPQIGSAQPGVAEGAAASPDGSSVFVANSCGTDPTCGSGGTVSVFDTDSDTEVASVPVGVDPLGVAVSGPWDPQQNQSSLTSSTGPAVAWIGPYAYFAEDVSGTVMYEWFDSATHGWGATASVPGASSSLAPALTAVGDTLWAAWTTSSDTIEYNELDTSTGTWMFNSAGNIPPVPQAGTDKSPELANLDGVVYVAWKGHTTDGVFYTSNDNGSWSSQASISGATTGNPPAIAALGSDTLEFAWTSETTDRVYFDSDIGGTFGTATLQPQAATHYGPALAVTPSGVYLMWAEAGTGTLAYSLDTAGGWTPERFVPSALTGAKPALAAAGYNLYAVWQGSGNTTLWYDSFD